jgi:hypothetical protein
LPRRRANAATGRQDRARCQPSVEVGHHLLLDGQVLDHGLDHEVAGLEAGVLERRLEQRHLAPQLGRLQPAAAELLAEQVAGVAQRGPQRLGAQVLDPHR